MKKNLRLFILSALAAGLLQRSGAFAMEIPLEGFGKTTKVAYVNMHKIFEAFPETEKARTELNEMISQKRSEITARKQDIAKLKGEIEFLRKQKAAVDPKVSRPTPTPQPAASTDSAKAPDGSTSLVLPEGSPLKFLFSPPAESTAAVQAPPPAISSGPQILPGIPSPAPQLEEKEAELSKKQADLEAFVGLTEQEIKKLEEGKTMTLMARIYKTIEEIAAKEGYAVIVDRDNILYGETAVDITQSVIWKLGSPLKKKEKDDE